MKSVVMSESWRQQCLSLLRTTVVTDAADVIIARYYWELKYHTYSLNSRACLIKMVVGDSI
jgi:hypothetical protein